MTITQPVPDETRPPRPLPIPTALSRPFWEGCSRGELLFQRCPQCAQVVFPPQAFCPIDLGTDLAWERSNGTGTVYSFTIVERPATPAFEVPYVVGVVELYEGYTMMTNIVGCAPDDVRIGLPAEVQFEQQSAEITLPCFRLAR